LFSHIPCWQHERFPRCCSPSQFHLHHWRVCSRRIRFDGWAR
jgi:hypothetical protein